MISALPGVPPSLLGESPLWHPAEQVLYGCDIPGHALNRFDSKSGAHTHWPFETDVACRAPRMDGGLLQALRSGIARENRPADELAREPLAGCVLQTRVDVPGLPASFARA